MIFVSSEDVADPKITISDFGEAFFDNEEEHTTLRAPITLLPPEFFFHERLGPAVDVWTLGCTLCEILGERHLFEGFMPDQDDIIAKILSTLGDLPKRWWEQREHRNDFLKMIHGKKTRNEIIRHTRDPCEPEDEELAEKLQIDLQKDNEIGEARVQRLRDQALIQGTPEFNALRDRNAEIKHNNDSLKAKRLRKGIQLPFTVKRFFKHTPIVRQRDKPKTRGKSKGKSKSKGGLDGYHYANRILRGMLIPYYQAVQAEHPNKEVYLTLNNSGVHDYTLRIYKDVLEEAGVKIADWPALSPDLHSIKQCFNALKDYTVLERWTSSSQEAKDEAKDLITKSWKHNCR
ncbi:hypothetical protein W97_00332 [Coniosporium apollinis CBS 100218]|uniref:Protein kinase domain-containing protein n=1 Tax=Coniosporium apollinis (strain CBS 100218) TaxID=1168221 RepID=R7YHM8_CONA1|nr:uncharacterized protein W97_00332 [Coniosporium apollinis CBS 100218]EON61121.1 hypothetical protein W97_00332 [Coniosporium apollinis CBS 100218]